jgi:predicted ATPase/class 3 adenylate cyclase
MLEPPAGTVTLLFTDIEGSTRLLETVGRERYAEVLTCHRDLLRSAFAAHGGHEVDEEGDALFVAFAQPSQAVAAAALAQAKLAAADYGSEAGLRVRMGMHTGEVVAAEGKYVGVAVHRAARISAAAHGGQVLLSQATADVLADEDLGELGLRDLGGHRLKDLSEPQRLYQLVGPVLPAKFPALRTLESRPTNLPVQPTPLVGREREVQELAVLLAEPSLRVLTLTGPGGVGKTRLALQVAAEAVDDYADGVFFVNLAPLDDADLVIPTIAQTLGLREQLGQQTVETLREALRERELLMLLDNFEQVLDAGRELAELLAAAPRLRLLVTSRASLRLSGEHEYAVPPLATEEALALFAERARAVKAAFVLNGNRTLVAEICRRLDYLPLAVELAAARIKLLPEKALLARLDERLELLTGGARDLPGRQQTLRAAIDWSYGLLSGEEQTVFCRLAVFAGGRSLEAIEAVCSPAGMSDPLGGVASLVDKSLLRQEETDEGEPRFVMLETIHEYARERLEALRDAEAVRRQHADFFLALAEEAEPQLIDHNQARRLREFDRELGNVRVALRWFVDAAQPQLALRLASALLWYWDIRGKTNEGRTWLTAGLAAKEALPTPVRAKALAASGTLALRERDCEASERLLGKSLAIYRQLGDDNGAAQTLWALSFTETMRGEFEKAASAAEEGARLARDTDDRFALAEALNSAGILMAERGEPAKARSLLEEAAALFEQHGDLRDSIHARGNLAEVMLLEGEAEQAAQALTELLRLQDGLGERSTRGDVLRLLGLAHLGRGALEEAASALREAVAVGLELGLRRHAADCIVALGSVLGELSGPEHAALLWGAAEAARETSADEMFGADRANYERSFAQIHPRSAEEAWQEAWSKGRRMTLEQAAAYADAATDRSVCA